MNPYEPPPDAEERAADFRTTLILVGVIPMLAASYFMTVAACRLAALTEIDGPWWCVASGVVIGLVVGITIGAGAK